MILSRKQILEAQDIQTEAVAVPEWGGDVLVRALTGAERDAMEAAMVEGKGKNSKVNLSNLRARMVAASAVDEDGSHLFTPGDVGVLGTKSAAALERVFSKARELSGMTDEDVEELTKNSEDAPSDASGSD